MSWREELGRVGFEAAGTGGSTKQAVGATFRGVPFFVETAEHVGGRRGVTHEYPFRDEPFREDLGRKTRGFTVDGYVCGDDYLTARDVLLQALELNGPGELRHPYYGTRQAAVLSFRVRESSTEGGVARLSIEFEETPSRPVQPVSVPDAGTKVRASAAAARVSIGSGFLEVYDPGVIMGNVSEQLRRVTLAADTSLSRVGAATQDAASARARFDTALAAASALVLVPAGVLTGVTEMLDGFGAGAMQQVLSVYDFDTGERPPSTTSNRIVEQENFDALHRLVRQLVVVRAAELALEEAFVSYDDAVAARERITTLLDEQAELVLDDTYSALVQLRAHVVQAVPGAGSDLPRLLPFTPAESIPSLALAYQLYGSVAGEADVLARNHIQNPLFISGGVELQVLSDA